MSVNEWDEDPNTNGPAALRKALKKQAQELKELREALAGTLKNERKASVNEALASRGLDPRVAKFYPQDGPTDDEAVDAWVEENRELFGNRAVLMDGEANKDVLTDSERRGYEIQKDIAAFEAATQMDFKSRLDAVKYDPNLGEEENRQILLNTIREFDGKLPL
jgi:hypothetical protein